MIISLPMICLLDNEYLLRSTSAKTHQNMRKPPRLGEVSGVQEFRSWSGELILDHGSHTRVVFLMKSLIFFISTSSSVLTQDSLVGHSTLRAWISSDRHSMQ